MPDNNWTLISGSTPQDYTDTAVFEVNPDTKQIALITGQALVAGEKDSQYISFLMPRYWDGIDISDKSFTVEYALAGTYYGTSEAVNAEMTTEQVRFGWIVPETACAISGTLLFVLKITSEDYILKTQIVEHPVFKTINVEDVVPEPTKEAWYIEFQNRVDGAISEAEAAVDTAQATLTQVEASVGLAQTAAQEAQTAEGNAEAAAAIAQIRYGSPLVAQIADEMVEQNRVYVYTGSETGYTAGHWYYYDGTEWTDGGVYNGSAVNTDTTLTQSGMPADAKATGDEISQIKEDLNAVVSTSINLFNPAIEAKQGYMSPEGGLDASTLIPALDVSASSAYTLMMKAIPVTGGKTYAFPKTFVGRLSTYTGTLVNGYYARSAYVQSATMTTKTDCLMWTAPSSIHYICINLWKSGGVTQDVINSFMIIEVDDVEAFVWPTDYVSYGLTVNYNVLVRNIADYDVKGHDEALETDLQAKAGRKILNLYNSADTLTTGYSIGTTADIANMEPTGLASKSNYATSMRLIEVASGSTICVSKDFVGELGVFNPFGGRSKAFGRNDMTYENNCLKYTIPTTHIKYYIGVAFNTSDYTDYAHFVLAVDVSSLPNEFIPHTDYYLDAKVLAENVVGSVGASEEMKFAYALDDFNESYAARVQQSQGANCLTITFKTDSHTDVNIQSASTESSLKNASETGYIGDYLGQDAIVHGGDLLTTGYTSKAEPLHSLRVFLNRMYKFSKAPFMVAKGNHDDNCYDSQYTVNNKSTDILIMPEEWNAIAMQYAKKFAVCPNSGRANYCYLDNERTKTRIFVLDTEDFDYHVTDGVAELNSGSTSAFSNDQLNFVANALLFEDKDEPSEWAALFISHRPIDTTTASKKRMGIGDTLIRNNTIMLSIINAYKNGTRYTASGFGGKDATEINSHYFPYDVDIDYASKGQGEVIAFLFGHTHDCNTSAQVGADSSALSYGFRYIGCGSASFYTLVFNRDTKKINVFFYESDKAKIQLPTDSGGKILGLTSSDLNEYGDWETSWT